MNLALAFLESARAHATRPALFWGDRTFTYNEVADLAQRLAARLVGLGVQPGDRVGLWLKNGPEFVPALLGVLAAGAVVVPINNFLKPAEVGYLLNDAGINLLLTDAELAAQLPALAAMRPGLQSWRVEEFSALPPAAASAAATRAEGDLAVLIYTSGTTGQPKGAMLSHGNLLHNVASCRQALGTLADDRMVVLLPLFHSYMVCVGLLLPLLSGGGMILVRSLHPLKNVLADILQHRGTILPAIPQFYRGLVAAPPLPPLPLRLCVSGAAPLPVQVLRDFEARFHIPLIEGYGLSEASPVVAKNPLHGVRKPGSIGRPIPNVELSVQDDAGRMLGPGEVGELCVRGGNVMLGYWNRPAETAAAFRAGWLLTGDVGYADADGYFFITDRKKDMLLVNGINVYPREIEEVLYQFPGIREAAVIGRADPRRGEQPLAFVAPDEGVTLDPAAVLRFLRERLADYKVPRSIEVLPALPRNATGKILKTALREQAAGMAGQVGTMP